MWTQEDLQSAVKKELGRYVRKALRASAWATVCALVAGVMAFWAWMGATDSPVLAAGAMQQGGGSFDGDLNAALNLDGDGDGNDEAILQADGSGRFLLQTCTANGTCNRGGIDMPDNNTVRFYAALGNAELEASGNIVVDAGLNGDDLEVLDGTGTGSGPTLSFSEGDGGGFDLDGDGTADIRQSLSGGNPRIQPVAGALEIRDAGGSLVAAVINSGDMFRVQNALQIGGSAADAITESVRGTATSDLGSIATNSCTDVSVTVTGAATGDDCMSGAEGALEAGLVTDCHIDAADSCEVRVCNVTSGGIDPAEHTYSCRTMAP